jgi:hypothetical protein
MLADPWAWYRRKIRPVYKKILQRAACFLLCALLSLGGLMAVSPTIKAAVLQWMKEWYEDYIEYVFKGDPERMQQNERRPTWLPEGYREESVFDETDLVMITYENEQGVELFFIRIPMTQGSGTQMDSIDMTIKATTIHDCEAELYLSQVPAKASGMIWMDDKIGYSYNIVGYISENDLIHMAESVS